MAQIEDDVLHTRIGNSMYGDIWGLMRKLHLKPLVQLHAACLVYSEGLSVCLLCPVNFASCGDGILRSWLIKRMELVLLFVMVSHGPQFFDANSNDIKRFNTTSHKESGG